MQGRREGLIVGSCGRRVLECSEREWENKTLRCREWRREILNECSLRCLHFSIVDVEFNFRVLC